MTITTKDRTVSAATFKAQCLALLDLVAETGQALVVTKRGKPVARVVPLPGHEPRGLEGSITRETDIVSPIDAEWEANA